MLNLPKFKIAHRNICITGKLKRPVLQLWIQKQFTSVEREKYKRMSKQKWFKEKLNRRGKKWREWRENYKKDREQLLKTQMESKERYRTLEKEIENELGINTSPPLSPRLPKRDMRPQFDIRINEQDFERRE